LTSNRLAFAGAAVVASAILMFLAGSAEATTFCVPGFFAACPNNGTNVANLNLENAASSFGTDGVADTIYVDASTYTDPATFEPVGTDALNIIGSGVDKTVITSSASGNIFVANLNSSSRQVDMSDLTIEIPASFPDVGGNGSALQAKNGTFDHVDIRSLNNRSDGADSLIGTTVWKHSHVYGAAGGTIGDGFVPNSSGPPGSLLISDTTIDDASWGVVAYYKTEPVTLRNSRINPAQAYNVRVSDGGQFTMENSVIVTGGSEAVSVASTGAPADLANVSATIRNSTIIQGPNADATDRGVKVEVTNSFDASATVTDSIIRGFKNTWETVAPFGPGLGHVSLSFKYSNFDPVGLPEDSPAVDLTGPGNINQDPMFAGANDFRLMSGSPSIDTGDPAPGGILDDYDGAVRPQDGNGDGSAIRDQGAYEAPIVPTCLNTASLCPPPIDTTKPVVSKVKFKAPQKKAGSLMFRLSEAATVKVTFKPVPAKKKPMRKTVKLSKKAKAGANTLKLKKGKLKSGKYRLTIVAVDVAGNESKPIVKKVRAH